MKSATVRKIEFSILLIAIVSTFLVFEKMEMSERVYLFSRNHENFQLDEWILTIATSFLYLLIFTVRRYFELLSSTRRAITDPMVDTLNRRGGMEILENTKKDKRTRDQSHSLILFDIDNFKSINDDYGHDIGDKVLKRVSHLCSNQLRGSDSLIRWGGEEFLVLCPNTYIDDAAKLAERIRFILASTTISPVPQVTASFGVSEMMFDVPLKESIRIADQRQYISKNSGKNKVTWQDSEQTP